MDEADQEWRPKAAKAAKTEPNAGFKPKAQGWSNEEKNLLRQHFAEELLPGTKVLKSRVEQIFDEERSLDGIRDSHGTRNALFYMRNMKKTGDI